jgi:hypothetical protein
MVETVAALPGGGTMGVPVPLKPPPSSIVAQAEVTGKRPGGTNREGVPEPADENMIHGKRILEPNEGMKAWSSTA